MSTARLALAALLVVGAGCSSSSDTPPAEPRAEADTGAVAPETGGGEDTGLLADAASDTPAGPCGNKVGDVLCDVQLEGYIRNETTGLATDGTTWGAFTLDEALGKATQPYAFVYNSSFW
jgi:hypothetical protein